MREEYEELDEEGENDVVDETSMTSNKKKNLIITSIVSLLLVLCIAIGISLAPKHSSTSTNYNHHKDKFTSTNDIIRIDNDISHFLKADTTEVRSESNTCPSGKELWNMKLVTDLYGYETDWALYDEGTNERIAHGPPEPYNYEDLTTYQGNLCLPYGDYYIKWMDMSADGICCDFGMGSWTVKVNNNMILQSSENDNYKEKDYRFSVGTISENIDRDNFAVSVNTQIGLVIGTNNDERFVNTEFVTDGVDSFLGIKYGRIPGRFRKSQLYEQRRDFIDATDFGPFCWQSVDMPWYEDQQQSEDCLYLNIWRPRGTSPTSRLAVMVYLHAGGLNYGGSAEPPSYGHNLAVVGNVIVVNINFRLGVFGFMSTDNNGSNGMNGIYDQIVALRWIRKYIGNFGGDKNRVTLFGLGSGSASVCLLSVSPAARGLFQRAIMSSGECMAGSSNRPGGHDLLSPQDGYAITQSIQNTYGALSVDDLRNPNLYPASEIYNARVMGDPVLDRAVLQGYPQYLYRNPNNINPFQMIVGSTTYADEQLVPPSPYGSDVATDLNAFYQTIQDDWPGINVNRVKNAYSPQNHYGGSVMNAQSQYEGDVQSFCDTRQFASYLSEGINGRVYLYQYGALTSYDAVSLRGLFNEFTNTAGNQWATFGSDLVMVFGTYKQVSNQWWYTSTNTPWDGVTAAELSVSDELMSRWSSFAKSGNPNTDNMYQGWSSVPKQGPNYNGQATQINQFYFSLNLGGFMSSSALLDDVIRRCGSFPNWPAFAINTPKPTRRPTKHPTTYHPTLFPTLAPSLSPTWAPTLKTKRPTKRPTAKPSTTRPTTTSPSSPRPTTARPTTPPPITSQPSNSPTVNPSTDRLRMLIDEPEDSDSDTFDHILV